MTPTDNSTQMDDVSNDVGQNQGATDDRASLMEKILNQSEFFSEGERQELDLPVPEIDGPDETAEEDLDDAVESETEEQSSSEEVEADAEEEAEGDDEESTSEGELPTADDIDWDYQIPVKIDGVDGHISLKEMAKGYQTDEHLSKKGRELGEQKNKLEQEYSDKLNEANQLSSVATDVIQAQENHFQRAYFAAEEKVSAARAGGNSFEMEQAKDAREQAQKNYWAARNHRETLQAQAEEKREARNKEVHAKQMEYFESTIRDSVPDYDENVAMEIRNFALEEGVPETILNVIADPSIIKFVDDYRRLKKGVSKGTAKRKQAPVAKGTPKKKAAPAAKKKVEAEEAQRSKVLSGNASKAEGRAFLASKFAHKHFK